MSLKLYDREELIQMGKDGWYIIPCKDDKEPSNLIKEAKSKGYEYQIGHVMTRSGVDVPFIIVKGNIKTADLGKNKVMKIKRDGKGRPKKLVKEEPIKNDAPRRRGRPKKEDRKSVV